jgi:hypothetical protein
MTSSMLLSSLNSPLEKIRGGKEKPRTDELEKNTWMGCGGVFVGSLISHGKVRRERYIME